MIDRPAASFWLLVLVGLAAGFVGGGLGLGGGIVLVPLLLAIGIDQHRAHATSVAAIILIAIAGAATFAAAGELHPGLGVIIGLGGIVGAALGASLMHRMSARTLSIVFALVLLVAAIRMLTGATPISGSGELGDVLRIVVAIGIGLLAGLFAGVAGVGGGVVIVPATVILLGLGQHEAQGTSLTAIILTTLAATVVNYRNKRVRLKDGLVVGIGGVAGSVAGSRLALGVEGRTLSLVFGYLVLFVSLRMLYRAFRQEGKPA